MSKAGLSNWTQLFYAVLVNLGDAVADESLMSDEILLEMIYRALYHFLVAHQKGNVTEES